MASLPTTRRSPAAPGRPHVRHRDADATGLPVPAPDKPDALAGLSIVLVSRDDATTARGAGPGRGLVVALVSWAGRLRARWRVPGNAPQPGAASEASCGGAEGWSAPSASAGRNACMPGSRRASYASSPAQGCATEPAI